MIIYFEFKYFYKKYSDGQFQNFRICKDDENIKLTSMGYCDNNISFQVYCIEQNWIYLKQALQPYGDYYRLGLHDYIKKHLRELKLKRICDK